MNAIGTGGSLSPAERTVDAIEEGAFGLPWTGVGVLSFD